mmetsp:Transcript_39841/g.105627  ORF Transcript_39841/g.105627 Transcript_39841/m.105627 type:complete len:266 (+) Transcript_39841:399-1196(+)
MISLCGFKSSDLPCEIVDEHFQESHNERLSAVYESALMGRLMLLLVRDGPERTTETHRGKRLGFSIRILESWRRAGLEAVAAQLGGALPHGLISLHLAQMEVTTGTSLHAVHHTLRRGNLSVSFQRATLRRTIEPKKLPGHAFNQLGIVQQLVALAWESGKKVERVHEGVPKTERVESHGDKHISASTVIIQTCILSSRLDLGPVRRCLHPLQNFLLTSKGFLVHGSQKAIGNTWIVKTTGGEGEDLCDELLSDRRPQQHRTGES